MDETDHNYAFFKTLTQTVETMKKIRPDLSLLMDPVVQCEYEREQLLLVSSSAPKRTRSPRL
jgi:hypothetical protein